MKYLKFFSILLILVISGCSSAPKNAVSISSEFASGDLRVTYNKKGEFESISSKATAYLTNNLPNAKDQAVTIATLKARRQIAEFLKTEVQSERFLVTVSKSIQETETLNQAGDNKESAKIAYNVRESIRQRSSSILQGTYLQSESFNPDTKIVTVVVSAGTKENSLMKDVKKVVGQ
jgi:hypothetical protein